MATLSFSDADLQDHLPAPGTYPGTIVAARLRRSAHGHRMVEVRFALDGAAPDCEPVADYFVLEGATPRGLAVARAKLVALYRACGRAPHGGDEIRPADLLGARLEVQLAYEQRADRAYVRVVACRSLAAAPVDDDVPF
jgi:hypothetical protein